MLRKDEDEVLSGGASGSLCLGRSNGYSSFPAGAETEEAFRSIVSSRWIQGERWRSAQIATFKKTREAGRVAR